MANTKKELSIANSCVLQVSGILCVLLASARFATAASWIVEGGQPQAEIVIADRPPRSVRLAAGELRTYIEKLTGARLGVVTAPTGKAPVKVFVGESDHTRSLGVTAKALDRDAFRMVSGPDWLALVGRDRDSTPTEPWARSRSDWLKHKQSQWEALAGHPWRNPIASSIYRDYNKRLDVWNYDYRGSLNAVYALLRELGVRWYMPGELGEIVPKSKQIALLQAYYQLYFGILCEGDADHPSVIGARQHGDPAIWDGEHVELLVETDKHSYYQIVVNPAGAVMDLERGASKAAWYDWRSQAEAAAYVGEGYWSVEVRLPVTPSDEDPLPQVMGSRPFKSQPDALATGKGTCLPWHFNLFRKRSGTDDRETTAFSPLGPDA